MRTYESNEKSDSEAESAGLFRFEAFGNLFSISPSHCKTLQLVDVRDLLMTQSINSRSLSWK